MKKQIKYIVLGILITLFTVLVIFAAIKIRYKIKIKAIKNKNTQIVEEIKKENLERTKFDTVKKLAPSVYIDSQFICQAPLETEQNWTLHEESCEEAALLQVYLQERDASMSKTEANQVVLDMINWQENNFGGHYDIYADKIKEFTMGYYKLDSQQIKIIYDADIEDIKKILNDGHTIMVPVTAKYLKNPYYPHEGYHMLQVIGYNEEKIITNENGTKNGADYAYSYTDFTKAMEDSGADIIYLDID
ncbi:hypothetical protein GF354_02085 [Candidatus Peregrinibacteria bacterium]|nr:hypothetical protein [Candidatus Peregrinibacteria bacterium]